MFRHFHSMRLGPLFSGGAFSVNPTMSPVNPLMAIATADSKQRRVVENRQDM